jgi:hypothetical protein
LYHSVGVGVGSTSSIGSTVGLGVKGVAVGFSSSIGGCGVGVGSSLVGSSEHPVNVMLKARIPRTAIAFLPFFIIKEYKK